MGNCTADTSYFPNKIDLFDLREQFYNLTAGMAFFTYIIKSVNSEGHYFGHCKDFEVRLIRHNKGRVKSTKAKRPWKLHYLEEFPTKSEAFLREKFFKSFAGRKWLYENKIL